MSEILPKEVISGMSEIIGVDLHNPFMVYVRGKIRVLPFQSRSGKEDETVERLNTFLTEKGYVPDGHDKMAWMEDVEKLSYVSYMAGMGCHTGPMLFFVMKKATQD